MKEDKGSNNKNSNNGQPHSTHRISHETVRHHEQELKPLKEGEDPRFRTIVHRVTTLIIENVEIVRPQATPHPDHGPQYREGDHIMFDAGVEGDMVVSIAHNDRHRQQQQQKRSIAVKSQNKDEL